MKLLNVITLPQKYDDLEGKTYAQKARSECDKIRHIIRVKFGHEPENCGLVVRRNLEQTLFEIQVLYHEEDEKAKEYAYKVKDGVEKWREILLS